MISFRAERKTLLIAALSGILVVVFLGIFSFLNRSPAPTCTDGIQNGDERGVDCGGICGGICPGDNVPLGILWSKVFPVGKGVFDVAAEVQNSNPAATSRLPFTFKLYDGGNILITEVRGETFVGSGEAFLLFKGGISIPNRVPERVFLELGTGSGWVKKESTPVPLVVRDVNLDTTLASLPDRQAGQPTGEAGTSLSARVENTSFSDVSKISVTALITDAAGEARAVSSTYIENLAGHASAPVFFRWPFVLPVKDNLSIQITPRFDSLSL
jgi:hypothetical protein